MVNTFAEIVEEAIKKGYRADIEENFYELTLKKRDGIIVKLSFSNDKFLNSLKDGTTISWEFKLIDDKSEKIIYKDWREHYGNGINILIEEMRDDVRQLIHNLSTYKLFGLGILKYKDLNFINDESEHE